MTNSKNPSPEELAHYGVLGMKWGHRKKATTTDILAARKRLAGKHEQFRNLEDARDATSPGSKARLKADRDLDKYVQGFNKDPDRVIATRMTQGEKIVTGLLAGPVALIPIAATSAVSRRIEKKQDDNAYDKK